MVPGHYEPRVASSSQLSINGRIKAWPCSCRGPAPHFLRVCIKHHPQAPSRTLIRSPSPWSLLPPLPPVVSLTICLRPRQIPRFSRYSVARFERPRGNFTAVCNVLRCSSKPSTRPRSSERTVLGFRRLPRLSKLPNPINDCFHPRERIRQQRRNHPPSLSPSSTSPIPVRIHFVIYHSGAFLGFASQDAHFTRVVAPHHGSVGTFCCCLDHCLLFFPSIIILSCHAIRRRLLSSQSPLRPDQLSSPPASPPCR